jgi:hypothetical protein
MHVQRAPVASRDLAIAGREVVGAERGIHGARRSTGRRPPEQECNATGRKRTRAGVIRKRANNAGGTKGVRPQMHRHV